jgi:uridine kinase
MSRHAGPDHAVRDPDAPIVGQTDARSAVLFGPPGTGKTSIVEALAGALGWQFVEVLASDFLSGGVDAVPARADIIFERLMQLDRCVVLFDEIDELIRDRTTEGSDPFGRFLTTSMLPKIAKLWKQRRIIFFVATNHISVADPAITRSSRFDARIFVATPSIQVKRRLLTKELGSRAPKLDARKIKRALDKKETDPPRAADALAVLPLLRYDQIPELARLLRLTSNSAAETNLLRVLGEMRDKLLRHEWQPARPPAKWEQMAPVERLRVVYNEYIDDHTSDSSRTRAAAFSTDAASCAPTSWDLLGDGDDVKYYKCPSELPPREGDGQLALAGAKGKATDRGILFFRER